MATPFLSSEEYDDRAHQLYNDGQYDDALTVLREGLTLYPSAVELHVGAGYAQLAREEFAWARHSFEQALVLEPEHEDGLAGLGETLLKLGHDDAALRCFRRTLELGYADDVELMLQIGRSLFREASLRDRTEFFEASRDFFQTAVQQAPDAAEAVACLGYVEHRLSNDSAAIDALRRALQLDNEHAEARIYLANILYDQGEYEAALYHFERTTPDDHWDELGIWRVVELKRSMYKLEESDPELKPWDERLSELSSDLDDVDALLMELDPAGSDTAPAAEAARGQLELFGSLLSSLVEQKHEPEAHVDAAQHEIIITADGTQMDGSWEEIVRRMRDEKGNPSHTMEEFMTSIARSSSRHSGVRIPTHDAETFVRAIAEAGLLRIVR